MDSNIYDRIIKYNNIFITYATPNDFDNLDLFLTSLDKYSDIVTLVYVFNYFSATNANIKKLPDSFKYHNIVVKYLNSNEDKKYLKWVVLVDCINQYRHSFPKLDYIFIDHTSFVNYEIDSLFLKSDLVGNVPYLSDKVTYRVNQSQKNCLELAKRYNVPFKKVIYGDERIIWFNNSCYERFKTSYLIAKGNADIKNLSFEEIFNFVQYMYGVTTNFPITFIPHTFLNEFLNKQDITKYVQYKGSNYNNSISVYGVFGNHNYNYDKNNYDKLVEFNDNNEDYNVTFLS